MAPYTIRELSARRVYLANRVFSARRIFSANRVFIKACY
jgi:hypothetical protein